MNFQKGVRYIRRDGEIIGLLVKIKTAGYSYKDPDQHIKGYGGYYTTKGRYFTYRIDEKDLIAVYTGTKTSLEDWM